MAYIGAGDLTVYYLNFYINSANESPLLRPKYFTIRHLSNSVISIKTEEATETLKYYPVHVADGLF